MPKRSSKEPSKPSSASGKWLTVSFQPVSLFSLKRSDATSMAARSNLVPTPYAIKMALLKVMLEMNGYHHREAFNVWIQEEFTWIQDLQIHVLPPEHIIVNRNGYKLRYWNQQADKDYRKANNKEAPPVMPMQDGYVFREWVHMDGCLQICCGLSNRTADLRMLFSQINYFGKRGCFFQYLPDDWQETDASTAQTDSSTGFVIQPMDDLGPKTTFARINPYSDEKMKLGNDRVIKPGLLPLQLVATSARYDLYKRQ